jgi:hypothetical protein
MVWTKVADGPLLRDVPNDLQAPGDIRDGDGEPLTGIFKQTVEGEETKVLLSHGHARFGWKYPNLNLVFDSPFVNDLNLYCCREGWTWEGESGPMDSDQFSIVRVAAGLKPFGVCLLPPGQPYESVVERYWAGIKTYSLAVQPREYTEAGRFELTLARQEPFAELFDLERFTHDWKRLIEASRQSRRTEGELDQALVALHRLRVQDLKTDYDYKNPPSLAHMIIVGLLFGYPLGTTAGMYFSPPGGSSGAA